MRDNILILIGLIATATLTIAFVIYIGTGTEANNYYNHLNDTVSGFIVPLMMR